MVLKDIIIYIFWPENLAVIKISLNDFPFQCDNKG